MENYPNINIKDTSYPNRHSIDPRAFAVRDLLLKEISKRITAPPNSPELIQILISLAENISVVRRSADNQYHILIDGTLVEVIADRDVAIYLRSQDKKSSTFDERAIENVVDMVISNFQNKKYGLQLLKRNISPDPKRGLSCILPAYNEEANINKSVKRLNEVLDALLNEKKYIYDYEIIVVNDGSKDKTKQILTSLQKEIEKLRCVHFIKNQGYGAAVHQGILSATYEMVFFSDSDNQFEYSEINHLVPLIDTHEVVCGYRKNRNDSIHRVINAWGWNLLVRIFFGYTVKDIDCAFKLFKKSALKDIGLVEVRGKGAIFNTELLVRLRRARKNIVEVPVSHYARSGGTASGNNIYVIARAFKEFFKLYSRLLLEKIGYFGFIFGKFSRTRKPLEVIEYRRSIRVEDENINCPLCNANNSYLRQSELKTCEDLSSLGECRVIICTNCRSGFTYPPYLTKFIEVSPDKEFKKLGRLDKAMLSWFSKIRVKRVTQSISTNGKEILDVGAGNCLFSNFLLKAGYNVTAIDPAARANSPDSNSINLIPEPFNSNLIERNILKINSFDAVTMWHSLEHFPEPDKVIDLSYDLLSENGSLYICVPNLNSLQADLGGQAWTYLDVPRHHFHFTIEGLLNLLQSRGFERFEIKWFSAEYEIFGFLQTFLNKISGSHNYLYYKRKKGVTLNCRFPLRARLSSILTLPLLPLCLIFSLLASTLSKPACAEIVCYKGKK